MSATRFLEMTFVVKDKEMTEDVFDGPAPGLKHFVSSLAGVLCERGESAQTRL
jgi:hypothetical protein